MITPETGSNFWFWFYSYLAKRAVDYNAWIYTSCTTFTMFSTMLLLLLCFISYRETSTRCVTGKKGSNVTLSCEFEARDIFHIDLSRLSKRILVCQNEECESENDRLFKKGSCDVIIKDLIFSDAGRYILRVHYTNDQGEVEREYHLHIHDEISVKTGEQLKMDVLLINADKVEKNSSGEWTEVWTRGHGVSSDRLTDRDGNLTISNFTVSDTGTYRVLDSEGEILIMVTVTDSSTGTGSKRKKDKPIDTEQHTAVFWILSVGLPVFGVLLALPLIILAVIEIYQYINRDTEQDSPQVFPLEEIFSDD